MRVSARPAKKTRISTYGLWGAAGFGIGWAIGGSVFPSYSFLFAVPGLAIMGAFGGACANTEAVSRATARNGGPMNFVNSASPGHVPPSFSSA